MTHSEEYLNDTRLDWWTDHSLEAALSKIPHGSVENVLEVGVGRAHWIAQLARHLPSDAEYVGVDFEKKWVDASPVEFIKSHPGYSFTSRKMDAHNLEFEDSAFDLVTCQTLLLHCSDPSLVVKEFVRVCRPGGILVISEPTNLVNRAMVFESTSFSSAGDQSKIFKVSAAFHEFLRERFGYDHDIGAKVLNLLRIHGVEEFYCWSNEKIDIFSYSKAYEDAVLHEYKKKEFLEFVKSGVIEDQDIADARQAVVRLFESWSSAGSLVAAPTSMTLTVGIVPT